MREHEKKGELSERILEYLDTVCGQIRWKEARAGVREEMTDHILSQKEAFLAEGKEEAEAEVLAVEEMGDGLSVGLELDRIHRPLPQWQLMIPVFLLLAAGVVCRVFVDGMAPFSLSVLLPVLAAAVLFFAGYFLDYTAIFRRSKWIVAAAVLILAGTLIFSENHLGQAYGRIFSVFYTASYLGLLLPLALLAVLALVRGKGVRGFGLTVAAAAAGMLYLILCGSFSFVLLFAVAAWVLLWMAVSADWFALGKEKGRKWFLLLTGAAVILGVLFLLLPGRTRLLWAVGRMTGDETESGFLFSLVGRFWQNSQWVGHGTYPEGNWGRILTEVTEEFGYSHDILLAQLAYMLGKAAVVALLAVFLFFFLWSFRLIRRQTSLPGRMTAVCIWLVLLYETVVFFAFNLGFLVLSANALPLVSYGNTALLINSFLMGLLLSVFRRSKEVRESSFSVI